MQRHQDTKPKADSPDPAGGEGAEGPPRGQGCCRRPGRLPGSRRAHLPAQHLGPGAPNPHPPNGGLSDSPVTRGRRCTIPTQTRRPPGTASRSPNFEGSSVRGGVPHSANLSSAQMGLACASLSAGPAQAGSGRLPAEPLPFNSHSLHPRPRSSPSEVFFHPWSGGGDSQQRLSQRHKSEGALAFGAEEMALQLSSLLFLQVIILI